MGSGLLLCLALGCGGDDGGGSEIKDGGSSNIDGGEAGGGVVTGRGGSEIDGGKADAGRSQPDGGTADGGGIISSNDSVDGAFDRFIAEYERAEQLECACLTKGDLGGCEEDTESASDWENYTKCLRDSVALDPAGSAATLDCSLAVQLQYSQCVAELESCGEDEGPLASCEQAADLADADCPPLPAAVNQAWDACE